jgi:hypothetical protein
VVRVPQTLVPAECTDHYRQVVKPQSAIEGDKNGYKGKLIDFQHFNVYLTSTKPFELVIIESFMAERCDCCSSIKKLCVKILTIYRGALNVWVTWPLTPCNVVTTATYQPFVLRSDSIARETTASPEGKHSLTMIPTQYSNTTVYPSLQTDTHTDKDNFTLLWEIKIK